MNNKLKLILYKIEDINWYDELDLTGTKWIQLKWEETHLLLDYIIELQEIIDNINKILLQDTKLINNLQKEINYIRNKSND